MKKIFWIILVDEINVDVVAEAIRIFRKQLTVKNVKTTSDKTAETSDNKVHDVDDKPEKMLKELTDWAEAFFHNFIGWEELDDLNGLWRWKRGA